MTSDGRMSAILIIAAISAATLSAPASAQTVTVRHDLGGPVNARAAQIKAMADRGDTVRIAGQCASACTMLLAVGCVTPTARLGFHGPSSGAGFALPHDEFERASRIMAAHYPAPIRAWFMAEGRFRTVGVAWVSGADAIRLGATACD